MNVQINDKKLYIAHYDSMSDFVTTLKNESVNLTVEERKNFSAFDNDNRNFFGAYDFEESIELGLNGDAKSGRNIKKLVEELEFELDLTEATDTNYTFSDEASGLLDVGTYLENNPEYWLHSSEEITKRNELKIHVQLAVSGKMSASEYNKRVASVVALVDKLEELKYSVHLVVSISTGNRGSHNDSKNSKIINYITIKNSAENYDFDAMAFISNSAFFRRLGFRAYELANDELKKTIDVVKDGGYGYVTTNELEDADLNIQIENVETSKDFIYKLVNEIENKTEIETSEF